MTGTEGLSENARLPGPQHRVDPVFTGRATVGSVRPEEPSDASPYDTHVTQVLGLKQRMRDGAEIMPVADPRIEHGTETSYEAMGEAAQRLARARSVGARLEDVEADYFYRRASPVVVGLREEGEGVSIATYAGPAADRYGELRVAARAARPSDDPLSITQEMPAVTAEALGRRTPRLAIAALTIGSTLVAGAITVGVIEYLAHRH